MDERLERVRLMLGAEQVEKLKRAAVLVAGVGGVGSYAAEGLARSGVGRLILIDKDTVAPSNLNRQIMDCEARIIDPDFDMVAKNKPWQEAAEMGTDEDVLITRREPRLDPMRDISYPDVLTTGVLHTNGIYEVQMRASRFNGPFLEGRLWQEPVQRIGIHKDDLLRALPYQAEDGFHLLSIFTGDHLSRADQKAYQELIKEGEAVGFGFSRMMTRS